MFRAKTVLVLGAGASVEVGLPVGVDLLQQIVELTHITYQSGRMNSGDHVISEALKHIIDEGNDVEIYNQHLKAAWQLGDSAKQALSIDNVIEALEDEKVELVGKLGICRAILQAEKASRFFQPHNDYHDRLDLNRFKNTWYGSLSKLLTENVKRSQVANIFDNLEIINFNYDRCLEHYLPFSLASYYGIDPDEFRDIMSGLVIHRPYGMAGQLPWQAGDKASVKFGSGNAHQLAEVAKQIRTFTERVEEGDELAAIRDSVSNAERVVFLGFAFHRQNVQLIAGAGQRNVEILATAYRISESDKSVIEEEIRDAMNLGALQNSKKKYVELANKTCSEFFEEYWRSLTAGAPPMREQLVGEAQSFG